MNHIYLHNTLTGKKEQFKPIKHSTVFMYHCGPTVYNYLHIGNLRAYVLADMLRRMFEYNNYVVHQVINITDVGHLTSNNDEGLGDDGEDKVEKMAKSSGKTADEITSYYTNVFFSDIKQLNVETQSLKSPDTIFPRATEHIAEQIELIKVLEEKGYTYNISDGVYFDTSEFKGYGKLGNIDIEGLKEGARLETSAEKSMEKRNITDFALWKFSNPIGPDGKQLIDEKAGKRFQEWESPWGVGFPGWHIECSAMSMKYLGETFDIHTGGIDHIPVHHNNEIAQSEAAHDGIPLAHYWLHNAFVNVPNGKMSKSKDNFIRLATLIEHGISPLGYRYWLLSSRYSSPVEFSYEAIKASDTAYWRLVSFLADIQSNKKTSSGSETGIAQASKENGISNSSEKIQFYKDTFITHINDDLDTPQALSLLWTITKDTSITAVEKEQLLLEFGGVLGLALEQSIKSILEAPITDTVKEKIKEREVARLEKDWKKSDSIRDEIFNLGYEVKDTASGQVVRKLRV
jgi:cysteinyl-tRNA synthetase